MIQSRFNFSEELEEILVRFFSDCQVLMTYNEIDFVTNVSKSVYERLGIVHIVSPIHSLIERIQRILIELVQLLSELNNTNLLDEIFNAVRIYNRAIYPIIDEL